MSTLTAWIAALPALLAAPGEMAAPHETQAPDRLRVVTTLGVLGDLAATVGGDRVEVEVLADPRQDPHYVEPRPTLMQRARKADVFIEVGLQLELWADKVVSGSGNTAIQLGQPGHVIASTGVTTLQLPSVLSREWGDIHPFGNPHIWLDPLNAKIMAANIARSLSAVDLPHADTYQRNLEAFEQRIDEALFGAELVQAVGGRKLTRLAQGGRLLEYLEHRDLSGQLGGWLAMAAPLRGRPMVSYHKTFIYLAKRFGFDVVIEVEEKPGIPPSARHRDQVLEVMRDRGVRTILLEAFYDRGACEYLAERAGARIATVPIDVGAQVGAPHYFDLIELLLEAALECEAPERKG